MLTDPEPVFVRLPPCRHCGSRNTRDAGRKTGRTFLARRCNACLQTFRVPAFGWVAWDTVTHEQVQIRV